ncbi:hypothetical protein EMN47_15625 [Prolixibacteraceae bacterium JC049]|nr:hypothetical protein [Prolixibacteraceae bacterium JC049]
MKHLLLLLFTFVSLTVSAQVNCPASSIVTVDNITETVVESTFQGCYGEDLSFEFVVLKDLLGNFHLIVSESSGDGMQILSSYDSSVTFNPTGSGNGDYSYQVTLKIKADSTGGIYECKVTGSYSAQELIKNGSFIPPI